MGIGTAKAKTSARVGARVGRAKIGKPASTTTGRYKAPLTNVLILQDASGSMNGVHTRAVQALNDQIASLRVEAAKTGQETRVSVYPFATRLGAPLIHDTPVANAQTFGNYSYSSNGYSTAIVRSTIQAVEELERFSASRNSYADQAYLVIVITDGGENEHGLPRDIEPTVRRLTGTDKWTFVGLGPRGSRSTLESYGFQPGNITEWDATEHGIQQMTGQMVNSYGGYFGQRAAGVTRVSNFFTTNLGNITQKQIKKLELIPANEYRLLKVTAESPIRDFVEAKTGQPYGLGKTYYQLTKSEKIQDHKDLLLQDKITKQVFGDGSAIRQILNFPTGAGEVRVNPGNHANWNIYVQSTSVNRKLVRGTEVLVAKN